MTDDFIRAFSGADPDTTSLTLMTMTYRDVPFFNAVRNASCEWLHDKGTHTLPEAVEWFRRGGGLQFLVVLLCGVPVGYCRVTDGESDEEKWVGMDIHPDCRGQGLARPVYELLTARLRAAGARRFRLRVLKGNTRARHIYDALGFETVAEMPDEVEMVLEGVS